jgi:hypothetical protein
MAQIEKSNHPEIQNPFDHLRERLELQAQLDAQFPEVSAQIGERLRELSPEELSASIPQIRKQLGILRGKQEFSKRRTLSAQIGVFSGQDEPGLPDFDLA